MLVCSKNFLVLINFFSHMIIKIFTSTINLKLNYFKIQINVEMSGLENCVNGILKHCNGRVSPRLSLYEKLEKAVELYCRFNNYPADKESIEVISSLISLQYAANPTAKHAWKDMLDSESWMTAKKSIALCYKASTATSTSTHTMVRRSQSTV